jgi:ribonuclease HI
VHVTSDSWYAVNAINKGWLENWRRKGFVKVKNPDLWMRLLPLLARHRVAFHWIKGHAGHPENERCDELAVAAGAGAVAQGKQLPPDAGYVPDEAHLL